MTKKEGGPCRCHRERERSQLQVEIGMPREYIVILIGKIRQHRMPMLPTPYNPSKNPHIRRHES